MMDKQKSNSPPFTQANRMTPGFKIPKKKPDDWCEEKEVTSPLAKLPDNDFRNVTSRRRKYGSSYEDYNVPRNKNSHAYYASSDNSRYNRQPQIILVDILKSDPGKPARQKNISGSNSCNDATVQLNPISSSSYKLAPPQALQGSQGSVYLSRAEREFRDSNRERESGTKYEARISFELKEQETTSSNACRDVSNTSSYTPRDLGPGTRTSRVLEQEPHSVSKASEQKTALKDFDLSSSRDKTYCYKRVEHQNKKSCAANLSSASSEASTEQTSDSSDTSIVSREKVKGKIQGNKTSSNEGCSSDPLRLHEKTVSPRRTRGKKIVGKADHTEKLSLETIVLSSDDDEGSQKKCRKDSLPKTSNKVCVSPLKDAEPMDHSSHSEDAVAEPIQSESSVLQLQFLNVYFGKKRGTSTDSSKFTVESIEIPMRAVPLCRSTCLTIETGKLQKYGLWLTNGADSIKSNAVIILWITPDYALEIEKQMQLPSINQASKLHEYIFLELAVPLTSKEQSLLCDIMKQASKHGLTTLAEAFTWDEMYSLLEHLPTEDCYFKSNCYTSAASQPPEAKKVKSNYTLMQKWTDGCYSVSMVPVQSSILKETLKGGTPIRLLVYPPPPTKGGLAVSSEDLECLEDGEFLNDVIIDFYLKYLMLEKFTKPFASSCHIFSSFFFKCLTRGEGTSNDNNSGLTPAERRHQRVKTWTRHVDIFKKDFIFVPVNENAHWYLAVICFPWLEKAVYEDKKEQNSAVCSKTGGYSSNSSVIVFNQRLSKAEEAPGDEGNSGSEGSSSSEASSSKQGLKHAGKVCKRPCILIFDSLKTGTVQSTVKVLREYLNVEYRVKQKTEREFSRSSMRDLHPKVPKQNNSTDCGLYLLQYVESFSQKPIDNFEPPMRLENWFPSCVINNKREEIRDLILRLHLQQAKKS